MIVFCLLFIINNIGLVIKISQYESILACWLRNKVIRKDLVYSSFLFKFRKWLLITRKYLNELWFYWKYSRIFWLLISKLNASRKPKFYWNLFPFLHWSKYIILLDFFYYSFTGYTCHVCEILFRHESSLQRHNLSCHTGKCYYYNYHGIKPYNKT